MARGGFRGRPLSAKTVRYIHTIVHKSLSDAVDAGIVPNNVADRAKPPRPDRRSSTGSSAGSHRSLPASSITLRALDSRQPGGLPR